MEVSKKIATAKTIVSTAASLAGTVMLARSVAQQFLPREIQDYLSDNTSRFLGRFSFQFTMVIEQFDGFVSNQIFQSAEIYLSTKVSPTTQRLRVIKPEKEKIAVKMERHEEVEDVFQGVKFKWLLVSGKAESKTRHNPSNYNQYMSSSTSENRAFEVTFSKKYKNMVLESYIPYIIEKAKLMMQETRTLKIFTMSTDHPHTSLGGAWTSVNLDHPSTFDTLAMDSELKDMILKDLERFVERKEHYRKIGKAWKRGYLLYGPPGTGKSSLIAAMANHLNFNIYDLELTNVGRNYDLRKLLLATANKSILVVEDIDCTVDFQDRNQARRVDPYSHDGYPSKKKVTLSGLFNAIDGLWSSCGDERIIIFTTNHKEKLDPALLRPGRMDVHIHMSYCTPCVFRNLASTYLGIKDPHPLFVEIEGLIESTEVTPAEVAEQLLRNDEVEVEAVLKDLIVFLHAKREQNEEAKAKKRLEEEEAAAAAVATQKQEEAKAEKKEQSVTRGIVPPSPTATTPLRRRQRGYTHGIVRASINLFAALFVLFFLVSFLLFIF